jgi:hypothetical protein
MDMICVLFTGSVDERMLRDGGTPCGVTNTGGCLCPDGNACGDCYIRVASTTGVFFQHI